MVITVEFRWLALLPLALCHMRHSALAQPRFTHQQSGYDAKYVRVAVEGVEKWMSVVCVREVSFVPACSRRVARGGRLEFFRVSMHPLILNKSAHRSSIFGRNCVANNQVTALRPKRLLINSRELAMHISAQEILARSSKTSILRFGAASTLSDQRKTFQFPSGARWPLVDL